MKSYRLFALCSLILAMVSVSCEEDYESNSSNAAILLTVPDKSIKAPGQGQYRLQVESNHQASVTANVGSADLRSLTIVKTVNLEKDASFGNGGSMTVDLSTFGSSYVFDYTPPTDEVDQLVGFTFQGEYKDGNVRTSDLKLVVTLSPKDNLPRRKWLLDSKIWVDQGDAENIKDCEKDDYYFFNQDKTMKIEYGSNDGGCELAPLNVYDHWELSEDEKTFKMYHHPLNNESAVEVDIYHVNVLTTDRLELQIDFDLSWLGLSTEETFIYKFKAVAK